MSASPEVLRQQLGKRLELWRVRASLTIGDAAHLINVHTDTIRRLEKGQGSKRVRVADVEVLLRRYGAPEVEAADILGLARRASARPWWWRYRALLPAWATACVDYEESSTQVRIYAPHRVPALLQTQDYAQAVAGGTPQDDLRVEMLLRRQAVLDRAEPLAPRLWVVLDESVLMRPVGGGAVMRAQMDHLMEMAERPRVAVQVMPLAHGPHPSVAEPFALYRLAAPELPDVVCRELLTGGTFTSDQGEVAEYRLAWDQLLEGATPEVSLGLLAKARAEWGLS